MIVVAVAVLLPIYAAVVGALTRFENLGSGYLYPADWAWSNFVDVWDRVPLATQLRTTAIYAVGAALISGIVATFTGYALSRMTFRGKKTYLYVLLICQVVPLIAVLVPLFRLINSLNLYDTYASIIVPLAVMGLPFPVLLLRSYFNGIPRSIEEAALVDGCGRLNAFVRVVIPLAVPGILTAVALVFFTTWQTFSVPLILSNSAEKTPVTVGIYRLLSDSLQPWELVMSASLIACLPPLLIFFMAQKFFVKGLTAGAVK